MNFREYLEAINVLAEAHPECLEYEVFAASDDEGNAFNEVHYFACLANIEDGEQGDVEEDGANAVLLN